MRVLFVTTNKHLPELHGGMEINTHELCRSIIQRGSAAGVLCGLAGVGLTGIRARLTRKILGTERHVDHGLGYPTWRSYDPAAQVGPVVQAFRPDIIVAQGGAEFVPLLTACLLPGLPVLYYIHTADPLPLDGMPSRHRLAFLANSLFTASLHPEKKIMGVLRPIIRPERYRVQTDASCAVFINPAPYKGLDIVLRIAAARPDIAFLFVANRPGQRRAAELANRPRNVRVIGPVRDMRAVYRRAKIVLAPTQVPETWGRIASEAQVSGILTLASDCGGLPESVGPGGLCLPPAAPVADWLAAFASLWDDAARYDAMRRAALEYAKRPEVSPDGIIDSFLAALRRHQEQR